MNTSSPRRLSLRAVVAALAIIQLVAPLSLAQSAAAKPASALSEAEREAAVYIKVETIRDVTTALASKQLQGRGTGQNGADIAALYIARRFEKAGLKPLGEPEQVRQEKESQENEKEREEKRKAEKRREGKQKEGEPTFLQTIEFKIERVMPDSSFKVGDVSLKYKEDFVVPPPLPPDEMKEASGALAFVGYGVVSPDLKRDDLAGIDVKGKIVVMLTGKPDNVPAAAWAKAASQQAVIGRLISKGAAGFVIIYAAARASQPFSLAATYLSRRRVSLADAPAFTIKLPPIVLISDATAEKILATKTESFADLKAKAQRGEFVSREVNKPATLAVHVQHGEGESRNVVGVLEGADPALKKEAVVYTAHYDAYGKEDDGTIYPGAADNALGVARLVAIAEAFAKAKARPRRSIIFLAVTGEEYGLLGAEYWVKHPTWPLEKIAADINYDGIGSEVWGEMGYLVNFGYDHSDLSQTIADVAAAMKVEIIPDPLPEEGAFYRSDHYAFVKRGVPSLYLFSGPAGDRAAFTERAKKWLVTDYHMATDTVQKDWNWKGAEQLAVAGLVVGMRVANQNAMPAWNASSPFNRPRGTTAPPPPRQ
jgi:Zn-dependent M28 family amino/carboxypeptidase